jgi:hypothetical protein
MPVDHAAITNFFFAIVGGLTISLIVALFTARLRSFDLYARQFESDDFEEEPHIPNQLEELVEMISHDEDLQASASPLQVPHIDLPGVLAGGGATNQACCVSTGVITIKTVDDPDEHREYNRRMRDRRRADVSVDEERRILDRRVWLRRKEDRAGKKLLTVTDAADTLGVPVEQIHQWLGKTDIPFYYVTDGRSKAMRFEINELLHWYSLFCSNQQQE